ncbi:MAG: universal stress protein [Betaproteobacteria bacterium]
MPAFQRILVDVDATAGRHPALDLAAAIARRDAARLTVVDVVPPAPLPARVFMTANVEQELVAHRGEHLAELAEALRPSGLHVDVEVLRGKPAIALVRRVLYGGHDLLIRSHGRSSGVDGRFGAVDMELLRLCPCPVWLVPRGAPSLPRRVLAAIHANPDDEGEQRLNGRIAGLALDIARLAGGSLTLLQAWLAYGEELLRARLPDAEFAAYVEQSHQAARDHLNAFVASLGSPFAGVNVEVAKGEADDVIVGYAQDQAIDLVVMGTMARAGLAGLVIGNTAERILQRLRCAVLAVKPDGFVSPIQP